MQEHTTTPSAILEHISGRDQVDAFYQLELKEAKTIEDLRNRMEGIVTKVGTDGEMGERATELTRGLEEATQGDHGSIKLEDDLGANVLGRNKLGTDDSEMRRDQLDPEAVTVNARYTLDTVLHENDTDLGHAGQDPSAASNLRVIDADGTELDAETIFEGNVVSNVSEELGQRREGLPEETYAEGADFVEEIGSDTVDEYVRQGGAHVGEHLQLEVWRANPGISLEQMWSQGMQVGMSHDEIIAAAEKLGKIHTASAQPALAA